jgi:hypothetical protein
LSPILILSDTNVPGMKRRRKHTLNYHHGVGGSDLNLNREPFGRRDDGRAP